MLSPVGVVAGLSSGTGMLSTEDKSNIEDVF
jgi:hypothetical protein